MVDYDPKAWSRIPKYGKFQQRKSEEMEITFAPLFLDFLFRLRGGESILDVASGAGTLAYFLEKERAPVTYTGFDITTSYLDLGKERFPQHSWVEGDARSMPFKDENFDYTFCINLLQHLNPQDVPKVVKEMCRVTKKAVFVQASFAPIAKEGEMKSDFPEDDGTLHTFVYDHTGYDQMDVPGWEWYLVAVKNPMLYMVTSKPGREQQYLVMERKA